MLPIVNRLEIMYADHIDFEYVDRLDPANAEIVDQYQIRSQPAFVFVDADGNILEQWFGVVEPRVFMDVFNPLSN